ncbi:MAG TPA: hypothetical protein VE860_03860 [Chthoniobacterales bacterium]|nr:hypothetical protein [Chthoniobacterales bacterium]
MPEAILVKRTDKRLLGYLTRQEMDALQHRSPCVGDDGPHGYIEADLALKEKALALIMPRQSLLKPAPRARSLIVLLMVAHGVTKIFA